MPDIKVKVCIKSLSKQSSKLCVASDSHLTADLRLENSSKVWGIKFGSSIILLISWDLRENKNQNKSLVYSFTWIGSSENSFMVQWEIFVSTSGSINEE